LKLTSNKTVLDRQALARLTVSRRRTRLFDRQPEAYAMFNRQPEAYAKTIHVPKIISQPREYACG
jgi:hypothetical protein